MDNVFKSMGKRLMQRVDAGLAAMLPRQAIVTRPDGVGVWARFVGESAGSPESRFPSTVAGAPAGTVGWVFTLGGKKGLFIATAPPKTVAAPPIVETGSVVVNSAGTTTLAESTLRGLVPGVQYTVIITGSSRFSPTTLPAQFSPRAIVGGVAQYNQYVSRPTGWPAETSIVSLNWGGVFTAPPNGELTVGWGVTWNAGSTSFVARFLTAIAVPV